MNNAVTGSGRRRAAVFFAAFGIAAAMTAAGSVVAAGPAFAEAKPPSNGPSEGSTCTVTSGPNKGKTGTITIEEGNGSSWCEGSWGGTECAGGRCSAKAATYTPRPPRAGAEYSPGKASGVGTGVAQYCGSRSCATL